MSSISKPKRKLTETPEQRERRLRNWRHNAFIGKARMAHRNAEDIANADSTSYLAKALARKMQEIAEQLEKELRTRIDLPLPAS